MPGLLTNLKILGLKDVDGLPFDVPLLFECMFNPDTYKTDHRVTYNIQQAAGGLPTLAFTDTPPMRFSIEFVIDATGVSSDLDLPPIPIPVQVLLFNTVTIDTNADKHRPNHLIVQWGTFLRQCVLESSTITYTLFDSNGIPLRAKINATFLEEQGSVINQIASMFSSPDLTHNRLIEEGDILPFIVYREYRKQDYYLQVARSNKLKNFRKLIPGTTINLPPIS